RSESRTLVENTASPASLLERRGSGSGALAVVLGEVSGYPDCPNEFAADHQGHPALYRHRIREAENTQIEAAAGERILKRFGRPLVERRRAGFVNCYLGAAKLGDVIFLEVDQRAPWIDDGNRHVPVVLARFRRGDRRRTLGGIQGDGRADGDSVGARGRGGRGRLLVGCT